MQEALQSTTGCSHPTQLPCGWSGLNDEIVLVSGLCPVSPGWTSGEWGRHVCEGMKRGRGTSTDSPSHPRSRWCLGSLGLRRALSDLQGSQPSRNVLNVIGASSLSAAYLRVMRTMAVGQATFVLRVRCFHLRNILEDRCWPACQVRNGVY